LDGYRKAAIGPVGSDACLGSVLDPDHPLASASSDELSNRKVIAMDETMERRSSTDLTVELAGEIDLANATELGDDLCRAIDRASVAIVVDLSQVTFIDSSAIAMMIRVHKYADTLDRTVTWQGAKPGQLRVLELVGVNQVLALAEWPFRGVRKHDHAERPSEP
jgi:anti-anti-sigma factor